MKSIGRIYIFLLLIVLIYSAAVFAQSDSAKAKIAGIIEQAKGRVGVAIMGLERPDTLTFNNNDCYPMQSVYKFPLALAVLSEVDKGIFSLNQKIHLTNEDLLPNTWSPLRDKYPHGNINITLRELLRFTVTESDNNGCDILFRLLGGTAKINQFIHNLGINGMSIAATEEEMHKDRTVQYKNCSTPSAMGQLLLKFAQDSILSKSSKDFLWDILASNIYGGGRIKGQLPAGTIVAHKTGSSGTNDNGIAAATNDAGIVTLPNGRRFVIVVFVSDSNDNEKNRDGIIASISKIAWDAYSTH